LNFSHHHLVYTIISLTLLVLNSRGSPMCGWAVRLLRRIHYGQVSRWELEGILRRTDQQLSRLVLSEALRQSRHHRTTPGPPPSLPSPLVNSRGMELAVVKVSTLIIMAYHYVIYRKCRLTTVRKWSMAMKYLYCVSFFCIFLEWTIVLPRSSLSHSDLPINSIMKSWPWALIHVLSNHGLNRLKGVISSWDLTLYLQ
jgi:hypothetical protein